MAHEICKTARKVLEKCVRSNMENISRALLQVDMLRATYYVSSEQI